MLPTVAVIRSSAAPAFRWKLFGQFLLERNIRLLIQSGVKKIYLDLKDDEIQFYNTNIKKYISDLDGSEILTGKPDIDRYILISANQFIIFAAFSQFEDNFVLANGVFQPVKRPDQFVIENNFDLIAAKKFAIEVIRTGSGGKLAQAINKRISIPISLLLAELRMAPNMITFFNFLLSIAAVSLILSNRVIYQAAGGILVQACSIIDGCDGEVARMTTRFSKLGGLFDTVSDQLLAVALIMAALVKVYINFSPAIFWINMTGVVGGVGLMIGIIIFFMRRYTESMSFASYNREFLEILPKTDLLARAMIYFQYLARKEFYSIMACLFCLFGALHYYMLFFTLVAVFGSIFMLILAFKYFPKMQQIK